MKKIYQEPDVELIRLVPQDKITVEDGYDGDMGLSDNIWFP